MYSQKAFIKLVELEFKPIKRTLFFTLLNWITDSKYNTAMSVSAFLQNQIQNKHSDLVTLAKSLRADTPEGTVARVESYVYQNYHYMTDITQFNKLEYWQTAKETFDAKFGDCEDLNGLIYVLCRLAGIPKEFMWCCLGKTKAGYHFWTLFYYPRQDKLCRLDVTINPQITSMKDKDEFELDDMYETIDYIFNEDHILK